jgi:hypothetical protein
LGVLQLLSGLVIVAFGFGVPITFAVVLLVKARAEQRSDALDNSNTAAVARRVADKFHVEDAVAAFVVRDVNIGTQYSFLMDAYRPQCLYFESLDILRKLLLVGVVVFIGRGTVLQSLCAAAVSFAFFALHVKVWPFKSDHDNRYRMLSEGQVYFTILAALYIQSQKQNADGHDTSISNTALDVCLLVSMVLCVVVPFFATVALKVRDTQQSLLGTDVRAVFERFRLGMASTSDAQQLQDLFRSYGEALSDGREGSNLSFDGCQVFSQKFFIASFPGIYEGIWRDMTAGVHEGLLCVACVFFQDGSAIAGQHNAVADAVSGCDCSFLAQCAPGQDTSKWDGERAPWGCVWFSMWKLHVRALVLCGQQAVVIRQTDTPVYDTVKHDHVTGTANGLGNAQKGELEFLKQEEIAVYEYDVSEYEELVDLALRNEAIPASRLVFGEHESRHDAADGDATTSGASIASDDSETRNPLSAADDD